MHELGTMNKVLISLLLLCSQAGFAQPAKISKEEFINQIFNEIADSSFSRYYLLNKAYPCNFKKYDYDEWVKYGLRDDIGIDILNELAKKSYYDTARNLWDQQKLNKAICIEDKQANLILDPVKNIEQDKNLSEKKKNKAIQKELKAWRNKPKQEKFVFCFSKPEFTDDFQYAVINVVCRCDDKACGMGATYLFKRKDDNWEIAGKMVAWENGGNVKL